MAASLQSAATSIVRTLRERGYDAYLVGGCVRDLILKREPADYDVATNATPDEVMRIFPRTWAVGAQFGVVLVPVDEPLGQTTEDTEDHREKRNPENPPCSSVPSVVKNEPEDEDHHPTKDEADRAHMHAAEAHHPYVEVATFRSDGLYSDGRHPDQVRFSQRAQEDVQRRDFTINGLLLDPITNQVLDFVGGLSDLHKGLVRTIGAPEKRFGEDKLRMLRAVRFAARFRYRIDNETFAAIRRLAPDIQQVSRERVREELTKMLVEGHARRAFELLDESGLLHEVLPEIEKMKGVAQPPQHPEGDVWVHTLLLLENFPHPVSRTLAWGALLHDVGKPPTFRVAPDRIRFDGHVEVGVRMAEQICRRLRMSKDDTTQIAALVANHMRLADAPEMKDSTFKRFLRLPQFDEHMALHRLDCLASHGDLSLLDYVAERRAKMPPEQIRPQPLLTGNDLIAEGYSPGPRFKEILSAVEDGQLEGSLQSRDQALEFVRSTFPRE